MGDSMRHEAGAGVDGFDTGDHSSHRRPSAVGADDQFRCYRGAVAEEHFGPLVGGGDDTGCFVSPAHSAGRQRVDEYVPQLATVYFRPSAGRAARPIEQHLALRIHDAFRVLGGADECTKGVVQIGAPQAQLAGVRFDVEQTALATYLRGDLSFIHLCWDTMKVQGAGENEATESGADDRSRHDVQRSSQWKTLGS